LIYYHEPVEKAKLIVFMFFVLTLVTSGSTYAFVIGDLDPNINSVFATSSSDGGGKDGSGGGSGSDSNKKSKSSSDEGGGGGGGQTTDEGSNNGGTSNTPTPPPAAEETTPTTEEATPPPPEANQQTCPDGSQADANGNCPSTPPVATGETAPPPAATDQTCPNGSTPDPTTGSCPPAAAQQNAAPQTLTTQTCPDGSTPDPTNGNCPTSTTTPTPAACPGGVARDANGICFAPDSKIMDVGPAPASGLCAAGTKNGDRCVTLPSTPPATPPTKTPPLQPPSTQFTPLAEGAQTLGLPPASSQRIPIGAFQLPTYLQIKMVAVQKGLIVSGAQVMTAQDSCVILVQEQHQLLHRQ
jgi:hypothetical protein